MNEPTHITLSEVEKRLASLEQSAETPVDIPVIPVNVLSSPYIRAAAVLIFYDPDMIIPVASTVILPNKEKDRLISELIGYSEMVFNYNTSQAPPPANDPPAEDKSGEPNARRISYFLRDGVRKEVLALLIREKEVSIALNANPSVAFNSELLLQRVLTGCLQGESYDPENMNLEELNALLRVQEWVEGSLLLPEKGTIERCIGTTEMLAPFRHLTGVYKGDRFVEQFRGRANELAVLRKYVGVAPPQNTLESLQRYYEKYIERVFTWDKKTAPRYIRTWRGR